MVDSGKHTPGAIRAANLIRDTSEEKRGEVLSLVWLQNVIDRETGCADMLKALEAVQEWMILNVNEHHDDCPCHLIDAAIRKAVGDGR